MQKVSYGKIYKVCVRVCVWVLDVCLCVLSISAVQEPEKAYSSDSSESAESLKRSSLKRSPEETAELWWERCREGSTHFFTRRPDWTLRTNKTLKDIGNRPVIRARKSFLIRGNA